MKSFKQQATEKADALLVPLAKECAEASKLSDPFWFAKGQEIGIKEMKYFIQSIPNEPNSRLELLEAILYELEGHPRHYEDITDEIANLTQIIEVNFLDCVKDLFTRMKDKITTELTTNPQ